MTLPLDLPAMPEARIQSFQWDSAMRTYKLYTYDDSDMRDYARAAVLADREKREMQIPNTSQDHLIASEASRLQEDAPLTDAAFVRDLLWNEHPECCGNPVVGATYMGQQEQVCCGNPEPAMLNDAQIVATLRARFPNV